MDEEKRASDRYLNDGSITISFTPCRFKDRKAQLLNVSECGLCFRSDTPLTPGTTVFVRASEGIYENLDSDAVCRLRTMGMVTVKWCRAMKRADRTDHEIGASYLLHY